MHEEFQPRREWLAVIESKPSAVQNFGQYQKAGTSLEIAEEAQNGKDAPRTNRNNRHFHLLQVGRMTTKTRDKTQRNQTITKQARDKDKKTCTGKKYANLGVPRNLHLMMKACR